MLILPGQKKGTLHSVDIISMGNQFLVIGKQTINDIGGNPLSAVAYDMYYHLTCLVTNKRNCDKDTNDTETTDDAKLRKLAGLEIIGVIKSDLNDERDKLIDMNGIQDTYVKILIGHGYCSTRETGFQEVFKEIDIRQY